MLDDDQLEDHVHDFIIDLCEVLYRRGYTVVPVGAMMRLIGVEPEKAMKHDDEYFELDETFEESLKARKKPKGRKQPPTGVTIH